MYGDESVFSGIRFHTTNHRPVNEVDICDFKQTEFLRTPSGVALNQDNVDIWESIYIIP